ncbi:hypothetical protein HJFPF1_05229 [Paramyrothecium foliicola]|nr:hypothetical protein HJFPF1_05229 [Paramyrothecium foliicola]
MSAIVRGVGTLRFGLRRESHIGLSLRERGVQWSCDGLYHIEMFCQGWIEYVTELPRHDSFDFGANGLFCMSFVATNMHMINITEGHDLWFIEFGTITEFLKETYVSFILYILGRSVIRFSIIFFYMRIFQIRLAKLLLLVSFVVNTIFCVSATLALACQCTPVNYFWLQWDGEHEGQCISTKTVVWALAVLAFVFDLWLIVLPVPFIARLKLSWQKKAQTSVMFVIGIAVLVVSAFRFTTITKFTTSKNPTMDSMATGLTSALELEIGIICASLPSIQVLFKPMFNHALGWTQGSMGVASSYQLRDEPSDSKRGSKLGVSSLGGIRLTTTIRQEAPTPNESETYLPLQGVSDGKEAINFSPIRKGVVKCEAWA